MRDIETVDSELGLVAALRRAAREHGGPLPSIDVADALLDERREQTEWINEPAPAWLWPRWRRRRPASILRARSPSGTSPARR
jgi:hypothetical protein